MTLVQLEGASKRFGRIQALDDVTLTVSPSSTVALIGPNGAGKSTLIGIVLGLRRLDSGAVRVAGRNPTDPRARQRVGAVLQETAFPQTLRVCEVVDFVARHYPRPHDVATLLERLALGALARRPVGTLSTGQRRRVAVALALVARPDLLVLDEPTAGLDGEARQGLWEVVGEAVSEGAAVLLATHLMHEAEAVATRVVGIARGRIVADGSVPELRRRAGGTLVRFRPPSPFAPTHGLTVGGGWATAVTDDGGRLVRALVESGVELRDLEVRPLTLEEALQPAAGPA